MVRREGRKASPAYRQAYSFSGATASVNHDYLAGQPVPLWTTLRHLFHLSSGDPGVRGKLKGNTGSDQPYSEAGTTLGFPLKSGVQCPGQHSLQGYHLGPPTPSQVLPLLLLLHPVPFFLLLVFWSPCVVASTTKKHYASGAPYDVSNACLGFSF